MFKGVFLDLIFYILLLFYFIIWENELFLWNGKNVKFIMSVKYFVRVYMFVNIRCSVVVYVFMSIRCVLYEYLVYCYIVWFSDMEVIFLFFFKLDKYLKLYSRLLIVV